MKTTTHENLTVSPLTVEESAQAISTIVLSFSADPAARWTWPAAQDYLASMPQLVQAFGGGAFTHGSAHHVVGYTGVALWLPPGVQPDEPALVELMERTVPSPLREEVFGMFEQMGAFHPAEPHWYLPLIGVDPIYQGRGLGDVLLRYALDRCDREQRLAYLESSNPRNISLYERHGFEALGSIQVGSSPTLVPMLRHPR
jgi:ribosomal protein S18 acetylase RimI-like enzyme